MTSTSDLINNPTNKYLSNSNKTIKILTKSHLPKTSNKTTPNKNQTNNKNNNNNPNPLNNNNKKMKQPKKRKIKKRNNLNNNMKLFKEIKQLLKLIIKNYLKNKYFVLGKLIKISLKNLKNY
jgi:hypothetical protein